MSEIPSGPLAGAAVSASALAGVVLDLVRGLPIGADVAVSVAAGCGRIRAVAAPRARTLADVAAMAGGLVVAVQATARAAEPADASAGLYAAAAAARAAVPVSASPVLTRHYALARALSAAVEAACLGEAFVAEARSDFVDRRAASEARDRIAAALDAARDRIATALGQDALALLATAAREAAGHLVRRATTLQPVVRVDAGRSYPSTALAWSIFGDPARADEIVARNRIGTPLFCPATFEVASPGST